jgi:hypothetical protein
MIPTQVSIYLKLLTTTFSTCGTKNLFIQTPCMVAMAATWSTRQTESTRSTRLSHMSTRPLRTHLQRILSSCMNLYSKSLRGTLISSTKCTRILSQYCKNTRIKTKWCLMFHLSWCYLSDLVFYLQSLSAIFYLSVRINSSTFK